MGPGSDLIMQSPTDIAPETVFSSSPTHLNNTLSHPSQPEMQIIPSPINTSRRRRPSKGAGSAGLKRSASTPNMRKLTAGETAMSLAEKRRNKLGYHRTSVACGMSCSILITTDRVEVNTDPQQSTAGGERYAASLLLMTLRIDAPTAYD